MRQRLIMTAAVLMLLGVMPTTAAGQEIEAQHADFSGTWTLDRGASEIPQGRGGRRGGGRFGGEGPATVTITQTDDEVVMEQQGGGQSRTLTYRLDGSPSENPGPRGGVAIMTSSWDDATLVTEGLRTISTPRGEFTLESHERRLLSDGSQTMIIITTLTTPRGDVRARLVYRVAD